MKNPNLFFHSLFALSLFVLLIFSGCSSGTSNQDNKSEEKEATMKKKQLRHVVLFKFKETATAEDIAKAEKAFIALPTKIPEIRDFEWGTNNSPEKLDKGFTHCFFLTFDSENDRAVYLPHPDHKAFGGLLGPILEDVLVLDYWTEG